MCNLQSSMQALLLFVLLPIFVDSGVPNSLLGSCGCSADSSDCCVARRHRHPVQGMSFAALVNPDAVNSPKTYPLRREHFKPYTQSTSTAPRRVLMLQLLILDVRLCYLLQMRDGGIEQKAVETANVVAAKASELGKTAWGYMRVFSEKAIQTVEGYSGAPGGAAGGGSGSGYGGSSAGGGGGSEPYRYGDSGKDDGWANWEEQKREERKPQGSKQRGGFEGWDAWDDSDSRSASKSSPPRSSAVEKPYSFSGDISSGSGSSSAHGSKSRNSATGDSWAGWDAEEDDSHQQKQSGYQAVGGGAKPNDSASGKKDAWDDWGGF